MKTHLRVNVLLLIGFGYATVLVGFVSICAVQGATEAYDAVKEPLMALIGGSLALSKDLLHADDSASPPPG